MNVTNINLQIYYSHFTKKILVEKSDFRKISTKNKKHKKLQQRTFLNLQRAFYSRFQTSFNSWV